MADDMDTEIISNDYNLSTCQQLISRLEQFNNISLTTKESKKQAWLQFLSLWREILQIPPSQVQPCYDECARLLPILFKATDFYGSRKDLNVARENCFICIDQLNQPRIKAYLSLTRE